MAQLGRGWAVPGYTELRVLGGGGFGEVVLARHDASGVLAAVKYLHPDLLSDPEHTALFRAEAATLHEIDDPHVVRLYEYVEDPAGAAIVMELVDGVTLADLLRQYGKTTPEAALVVLFGSLLGLAAAHARGIVHRDYKPANVLVNGYGASKLTDFGIAALAGNRPPSAGTVRYMSPEQFEGTPASPAGDVYAATITFYECLVGQVPFSGGTTDELYAKHRSATVPMDPVPQRLRPIIARGLAKDPHYRPSDAGLLAEELRTAALGSYGSDWEERGRSHLGEVALLLAALWPSSAAPAIQEQAVEQLHLSRDPRVTNEPHHPDPGSHVQQEQAGHAQHIEHLEHEHLEHVEHLDHLEHVKHLEHLEQVEHVEHLEHLEHLEHGHAEGVEHTLARGSGSQATGPQATGASTGSGSSAGAGSAAASVGAGSMDAAVATGASSPPDTQMQRVVRNVSRSNRAPHWVRRALPHDPSPGAATAIVAGTAVAVVGVAAVVGVVAGALTSGGSATPASLAGTSAPGSPCKPAIATVAAFAATAAQTVQITGSCLGSGNTSAGTDTAYFRISDLTIGWNACWTNDPGTDSVTCDLTSWTDNQVTFGGFSGDYGLGGPTGWTVNNGDQLEIQVWNPQSGAGPATCTVVAGSGEPGQCSGT